MHYFGIVLLISTFRASATLLVPSGVDTSISFAPAPSLPETTIHNLALSLSDPANSSYGAHLSQAALSAVLAPSDTSIQQITSWLEWEGVEVISTTHGAGGSSIDFHTTVGQANQFLRTDFEYFTSAIADEKAAPIIRSLTYSVPPTIAELIDFIHPVTHFPRIKLTKTTKTIANRTPPPPASTTDPCFYYNPSCLAKIYNINYAAPANETSPSQIGVVGFLEIYPKHADINYFLKTSALPANRTIVEFTIDAINFPNASDIPDYDNLTYAGLEAMLDLDYTMAFTNPMPVTNFYTAGRSTSIGEDGNPVPMNQSDNEPYMEFLNYFLSLENPPQVLSISCSDTKKTVPIEYAQRICTLWGAVAARGFGSHGIRRWWGRWRQSKMTRVSRLMGRTRQSLAQSSHQSVLTSQQLEPQIMGPREIAAKYSTGGFSNYFAVPDWQANATSAYISRLNGTYDGLYNKTGRAIPGISVNGDRYYVPDAAGEMLGGVQVVFGTSASTPTLAGMIALLNDERLRKGMSTLGWLNPLIHWERLQSAWNNITMGSNPGCDTDGFPAMAG